MCRVASVSMCFFYMCWHFTRLVQTRRKPNRTIFWEENFRVHIKTWSIICATMTRNCSPRSWCKESPGLQPSQKRRWMERKSGKCKGSSTYSFTLRRSGFQKTSSASLSSLLYPPDQWIEIPSGLHAIAVVMGHVRCGQGTSPSCTRKGKHGKHHLGTTHWTLAHRIADWMHTGSLVLNKLQRYLWGHWMVKHAKLECHPNIKLRHLKTIFFSDQSVSWHCLKASVSQPPGSCAKVVNLVQPHLL